MSDPQKALATQVANIEKKTGKSIAEFRQLITASGLAKHGEIRDMLKEKFGLGYGDANTVAHLAKETAGGAAPGPAQAADELYTGPKAALRPIHDRIMAHVEAWGDFEAAPKKTYLSLRRKKQFATLGPATNTRVELGLNWKGAVGGGRLEELPPKSMCTHRVKLTRPDEVDGDLLAWLRAAYDQAGQRRPCPLYSPDGAVYWTQGIDLVRDGALLRRCPLVAKSTRRRRARTLSPHVRRMGGKGSRRTLQRHPHHERH
jgi:hypothetical protein